MVIKLEDNFIEALSKCPEDFKLKFRMAYQQLKIVDNPQEIKGVHRTLHSHTLFRLFIDKSRIAMNWDGNRLALSCFLYNQFLNNEDSD